MSSSRPVSQESVFRSKLLAQTAEMRNRRNSNTSPPKPQEKSVSEISMKDFMDFLKISYQVNEAIEGAPTDIGDKTNVDWKKLTSNALLTQLKERESVLGSGSSTEEKPKPISPPRGIEKIQCSSIEGKKNESGDNKSSSDSPTKSVSRQSSDEKSFEKRSSFDKSSPPTEKTTASSSSSSLDKRILQDRERRPSIGRRKGSITTKKDGNNENETSRSLDGSGQGRTAEKLLKKKLNEVLQEGILDSVLPYLLPKQQQQSGSQPPIKKLLASNELRKIAGGIMDRTEKSSTSVVTKEKKESRRKSMTSNDANSKNDKKDVEVVIHVCDEIKNLKKDFRCSQKLLVSQMGYFAEVTTGQKLEDMDISVHCDVTIFDWLMRWVKKESTSEESWPSLDAAIVIPVLMSSAFLQMDTLQEHCLQFCRSHINEIVRDSSNLGCINDSILTRLANLFSNTEIENMKDRKDKLQSKLYCKLIVALTDPQPQPQRGHYSSIATMYRCSKCSKLISRNTSSSIRCVPSNMIMDRSGCINSTHARDPSWNLTEYVKDLKNELKIWRKVYWRLWSDCHLMHCTSCCAYFPLHQMSWCRFHSESAQFFSMENQRSMSFPIGRFPCCGERAYRFEILQNNSGCQYRDHVTEPKTPTELEIFRIWNDHKDLIKADAPPLVPPERMRLVSSSREENGDKKSPCKDPLWWDGLELVPPKPKLGLLAKIWDHVMKKEDPKRVGSDHRVHRSPVRKHITVSQPSVQQEGSSFSDSSDQDSSSSEAGDSEESCHATVRVTAKPKGSVPSSQYITATSTNKTAVTPKKKFRKKKKKKFPASKNRNEGSRFWVSKLSTRCNQDNQREFEERAVRQIEAILARKTSGESLRGSGSRSHYHAMPPGGTYVRLEQEWREAHCSSHGCPGSSVKAKGSNSYLNVNNSTFSMLSKSKGRGQR